MNAQSVIPVALCLMAIACDCCSAFITAKALALDYTRPIPSEAVYGGHDYRSTNRLVLFGHYICCYLRAKGWSLAFQSCTGR